MDFSKLFDLNYLFDPRPGSAFYFMIAMIVVFLGLIMTSFYLEKWISKHPLKKALKQVLPHTAKHLRGLGILGFVLLFFRYENLPYLSMRALLIALLISIMAYIGYSVHQFRSKLPAIIEQQKKAKKKKTYLPKSKKKKKSKKRKR
jgi:uncharacterized protein YacL